MRFSSSSSLRPLSPPVAAAPGGQSELPGVTAIRKKLVLTALERPVRFRTDLDVLVIQQYLASLEAFVGVALPALHYLATEATLLIDGSLCGYFNKAFSQRPNTRESFQVWNARQARRHGVLIDFGEFQSTYANGALCGFDDLTQGHSQKGKTPFESSSRRKGIDTLERMRHRFALSYEKGMLYARDTLQSDISYLGICSQLSEYAKSKLLQSAPRCRLAAGEELCPPLSDGDAPFPSLVSTLDGQPNAFLVVLYGRLDVFWGGDEDVFMEFSASNDNSNNSNTSPNLPGLSEGLPPAAIALAERTRLEELAQLRKTPLASIRRGQTFGDQMLGLALDKLYPGAQLTSTCVPVRLTSGDAATEIIWISKELYEEHLREDRVSLSYHPLSSAVSASSRFASKFRDWAPQFFLKTGVFDRNPSDLGELSRRMLADSKMAKLLFQFPPLVLERVCHAMELWHFNTDGLFLGIGDEIAHIFIVVQGALRILPAPPSSPSHQTVASASGGKSPLSRTSSTISTRASAVASPPVAIVKQQQDVVEQFVPGDVFGATELLERSASTTTSSRVVYVEADTLLLSVPKIVFERWLAPLYVDTIFNAGSCFQSLTALGQSGGSGRSLYCDRRGSKPAASPSLTRRRSVVLQPTSETTGHLDTNFAALEQEPSLPFNTLESTTHLLRKMAVLPLIPRFLLSEMLLHTSVVYKQAGDILFHEGEESQYLVVLLTGFLSFYSLEHMSTTIEMFQKHSFCHFSSFQGSQTNPEDFVADGVAHENNTTSPIRSAAIAKHRAAMHGVHIQTLHGGNAFRTGVLLDGTICPATVVAQANCECLVFEESVYLQLLNVHTPVIDLGKFDISTTAAVIGGSMATTLSEQEKDDDSDDTAPLPPGSLRSIIVQRDPTTLHPAVVKCFEKAHVPWLTRSPVKMQQLLRGMRCVSVNPGERLIRCNDVLDHLIIVLSGKLSLYIRQNEGVSTFFDASKRSVRSLMLERSITSNYSTTSQQLYKEAHNGGGGGSTGMGARGRIGSRQDALAKRKVIRSKISRISESGLFVNSVLAAVHEEQLKKRAAAGGLSTDKNDATEHKNLDTLAAPRLPESPSSSLSRGHSRPTPSLRIHSAAAKTKLQQKIIDTRRSTMLSQDGSSDVAGSLFLCHLGPGEVFGDEILAPHGIFRSVHDVFADNSIPLATSSPVAATSSAGLAGKPGSSPVVNNPGGAQLLLLDRQLFHSINSKTDAEIEKKLHVRSKLAKSKWHSAERKITRKLSQASINGDHNNNGGGMATPKLFDLFKNILNQRCFLTVRTIADIPLLRDLPDASKREICLAARFEALERGTNAYKENGAHSSAPRYYILISGRLGLYAKNLNGTFYSYSSSSSNSGGGGGNSSSSSATGGATATAPIGAENCLREVLAGDGFGEFEILVPELSNRCISALALESCRLLSFPASAFLRHWPHIASMKSDIEYLRTRVPFFTRLELEKIAYLYTTLCFQTFTRGSNIFEENHAVSNHFSHSGKLYLLKEGSCSIRQRVVLDSQQTDDEIFVSPTAKAPETSGSGSTNSINWHHVVQQKLPTHRPHHLEKHLFRVMVTVADVCDGHLFWIDGGGANDVTFPFTLQAVSASVTITNIAVDKLRAILPRTQLAALEKASNQMAALYKQQYATAQRAVVTLMNEKRAAQMGVTSNPTFLPMLNFQSSQKVIPNSVTTTNSSSTTNGVSLDASIPYSRLLMSKPVDLVALQDQERDAMQRAKPEDELVVGVAADNTNAGQRYASREWRGAADAAYRNQHLSEHYQLESGLPNSTLVGSFPDDFSLRRQRRSIEQRALEASHKSSSSPSSQLSTLGSSSSLESRHRDASSLKQDECMKPEPVEPIVNTVQVGGTTPTKLSDSTSHIHLEVKVPIFHDPARALSPRMPTPPSSARPKSRSGVLAATSSFSNTTPRSPRFSPGFLEVRGGNGGNASGDDGRFYDLEIDLRALLRAEMKEADAPMRTIKLEPSLSKANALGQYLAFSIPSTSPSPVTRPAPQLLSATSCLPKPKFTSSTPFKIFPRAKTTVKHTPVVPFSDGTSDTPRVSNQGALIHSGQASKRNQGFLCVVVVLDPHTSLASVLSRVTQQHKKRFFSLIDNVLVEFPENIVLNEPLDMTRSLGKYSLDEHSGVSDVSATIATAEAQAATLRMSFVLAVDANSRLILTAESAMEKKKWMNKLHQACALGPRVPMHQKIHHVQQGIQLYNNNSTSSAPQTPRTSSQSSRGQGRFASHPHAGDAGADLVLQVEYRIG